MPVQSPIRNAPESYDLVLASQVIEACLPAQIEQPGRVAIGATRLNVTHRGPEFLWHDARTVSASQLENEIPQFPRAAILTCATGDGASSAAELASRWWRPEQDSLVVLSLGVGNQAGEWNVSARSYQGVCNVESVRLVGPGLLRLTRPDATTKIAAAVDADRWSRERMVIPEALSRAQGLEIMIIGLSGTGTQFAWEVAASLPIRRLILVDPRRFDRHHLSRVPLLAEEDVGRSKVRVVADKLTKLRSDLAITCLSCSASEDSVVDAARHTDLLVTTCDTQPPRELAAHLARTFLIPHLDIGTGIHAGVQAGDVRLLLPGHGCAMCVTDSLQDGSRAKPAPKRLPSEPDSFLAHRDGSLASLNGINVSTAMGLLLDLLEGRLAGSVWHRMRWINGQGIQATSGRVDAAPGCRICHGRPISWN